VSTIEGRARFVPVRRHDARVMPLELFFDLVFVLAITQCTSYMADHPDWAGVGQGLLLLGILWWSWVGYAWLTSVVDPEEGAVRLVLVAAMAALLVAALAIPDAFHTSAMTLAIAYGVVRVSHIALFTFASRGNRTFRSSVTGFGVGTAVGVALLITGAAVDDSRARVVLWTIALALDVAEPFFFGARGWQLEPEHFVERHGLVVIVALGESIVAIGVGASHGIDAGVVVGAVVGVVIVSSLWWLYFDIVSIMAGRRLAHAAPGAEQNELARDAYSYLHFPLVAGIVLVAFGLKTTIAHVDDALDVVAGVALCGGAGVYLLAHVAFALRCFGTVKVQRLLTAAACVALIALAPHVDAIWTASAIAGVLGACVVYETLHYASDRDRIRHHPEPLEAAP
jgi:low temperature requirement protein LtrA